MPDMAKLYNEQAANFAQFAPQSFTFTHLERPAYESNLFVTPRMKILDIGSGSGRMARFLIELGATPENITGVEISQNLVDIARQQVPGVNFICGDARNGLTGKFDLITSHMVLEFFNDEELQAVLDKVYHLLNPGGMFCAITTHPDKMRKKDGVSKPGWFATHAPWGGTTQNWYRDKAKFTELVNKSGLILTKLQDLHLPHESKRADPKRYAHYIRLDPVRMILTAVRGG